MSGTTWGEYHVVGTYDGEVFTVTETGPPTARTKRSTCYDNPCPEPEGGWVVRDPDRSTQDHVGPAQAYAKRQPGYVISWVDQISTRSGRSSARSSTGGIHR